MTAQWLVRVREARQGVQRSAAARNYLLPMNSCFLLTPAAPASAHLLLPCQLPQPCMYVIMHKVVLALRTMTARCTWGTVPGLLLTGSWHKACRVRCGF